MLESRGRRGTFVRTEGSDVVANAQRRRLDQLISRCVAGAHALGAPRNEILDALRRAATSPSA